MNRSIFMLVLSLIMGSGAVAQGRKAEQGHGEKFAENKAGQLENLNAEKALVDKMISCVSSAQKHEDMMKCHAERQAAMQVKMEQHKERRKKHLQEELKKLDEQPTKH